MSEWLTVSTDSLTAQPPDSLYLKIVGGQYWPNNQNKFPYGLKEDGGSWGNRATNQKVAGSIPGREKLCCVLGRGTSPYLPRGNVPIALDKSVC